MMLNRPYTHDCNVNTTWLLLTKLNIDPFVISYYCRVAVMVSMFSKGNKSAVPWSPSPSLGKSQIPLAAHSLVFQPDESPSRGFHPEKPETTLTNNDLFIQKIVRCWGTVIVNSTVVCRANDLLLIPCLNQYPLFGQITGRLWEFTCKKMMMKDCDEKMWSSAVGFRVFLANPGLFSW